MVVMKWQVPSHSSKDKGYVVSVDELGRWRCDCPQGKYRRDRGPCKHVRDVLAGPAKATKLPSQEPGRIVTTPPSVNAVPAIGARLRNVKDVYAELKEKPAKPPERPTATTDGASAHLLAALDD